MKYGKLVENNIVFAPKAITLERVYYNPAPLSWLQKNGFKEVVYSKRPPYKEGCYYEMQWLETEKQIIQKWIKRKEPEPEPTVTDMVESIVTYNVMMGTLLDPEEFNNEQI